MWMPRAGVFTPLYLVRPYRTNDAIEHRSTTSLFTFPEFTLRLLKMLKPLFKIIPILHGERDQEGLEMWLFHLDDFEFVQVRSQPFCTSPDRAQRAQQMFFAETGTMQPHPIDRVVMAKHQVVPAALNLGPHRLMFWNSGHIIGNVDCSFLCLAVTINFLR